MCCQPPERVMLEACWAEQYQLACAKGFQEGAVINEAEVGCFIQLARPFSLMRTDMNVLTS